MQITPAPSSVRTPFAISTTPAPLPPSAPTTPPPTTGFTRIFDFPNVQTGDRFKLVKGSKANGWGISGEARVITMSDTSAKVWLKAGKFGLRMELEIEVAQTSPTTARISGGEVGKTPSSSDATIVDARTNYSEFKATEGGANAGKATLKFENNQFVLDVRGDGFLRGIDIPGGTDGLDVHLVLEKVQ